MEDEIRQIDRYEEQRRCGEREEGEEREGVESEEEI